MSIRNRELSQFGSFIYIDDSTRSVGIATTANPYVGIGTTSASHKFTVIGDSKFDGSIDSTGIISATSYYLNGNPLVDAQFETWSSIGSNIYRQIGNVGIGSTVPSSKLDIIGDVKLTGVSTASRFISTVSTGTAPFTVNSQTLVTNLNADYFRGKIPPTGTIVGTTDFQILTNKTLTLPIFTGSGVSFTGSTSGTIIVRSTPTASGIVEIPSVTGIQTFITTNSVGLVTSGMISDLSISNVDVSTNAGIAYSKLNLSSSIVDSDIASGASISISKLALSTISGVSLGNNLNSLIFDSYLTSSGNYNGSTEITVSVAGTSLNTGNTLVARDSSGDFTAGTVNGSTFNATTDDAFRVSGTTVINSGRNLIDVVNGDFSGIVTASSISATNANFSGIVTALSISATNANFTGIVTAVDFNSTSDINLKENITTVDNALNIVNDLRGVRFEWKKDHKPSYGVIAQELEQILPELVTDTDPKTVNYNGIIGVLIEAVKELTAEIKELKNNK